MMNRQDHPTDAKDGAGFEILGQRDRVEFRMLTDERSYTPDIEQHLIGELEDWRKDHPHPTNHNKPFPLSRLAERIGVSQSVLSEWLKGKYRGDAANVARLIDQFLADDRERAGRHDFRRHAKISLSHKIFGVINTGIVNNTMPCIIGPPGSGKTSHARAFERDRSGVLVVRIEDQPCDKRGVSELLCFTITELRNMLAKPHRRRMASIKSWLNKRRNTVLIIDEAQKLSASGLECLRDLHDTSDQDGHHNLPIVFFGDENFYKLLTAAKAGHSSPIAPQMIRRMVPVFDIVKDGGLDGDGDVLYSAEDIVKIVRNDRVKLLDRKALHWLTELANVHGYGLLGFAIKVLQIACDLMTKSGAKQINVELLKTALNMTAGRSAAEEIDQAAGGELLARTA